MRYHLLPPDPRAGVVSCPFRLGMGGSSHSVSTQYKKLWDMGWLQNPWVPSHPRLRQLIPGDQAFQKEAGFWAEGIMGES